VVQKTIFALYSLNRDINIDGSAACRLFYIDGLQTAKLSARVSRGPADSHVSPAP